MAKRKVAPKGGIPASAEVGLTKQVPSGGALLALTRPDPELPFHPTYQLMHRHATAAERLTIENGMEIEANMPTGSWDASAHHRWQHAIHAQDGQGHEACAAMTGKPVGGRPRNHPSQCE